MHRPMRLRLRLPPFSLLMFALPLFGWLPPPEALAAEWRPIGLQGIEVRSLAAAPDRLCAGTAGKGVFCLDSNSVQFGWRHLGPDGTTITGLWVDGLRPGLMFAAADAPPGMIVLFRSLDGGQTWQTLGSDIPFPASGVRLMTLVHGVPGTATVYGAGGAVWRSDDLGETWREVLPQAFQSSLEVAPTDPRVVGPLPADPPVWAGGEVAFTFAPEGYTALSRDGGLTWTTVWRSDPLDFSPTADISSHPRLDGVVLTGHEGFVLRTRDDGKSFEEVLRSPVRFSLDWGGGLEALAFAAGSSPAADRTEAYLSRDLGETWVPIAGTRLARLTIHDLAADGRLSGLAFAATNDGVYAFFGGGRFLCHDARRGVDDAVLWLGECPPILAPGPVILGDVVVAERSAVRAAPDRIDLGAVQCIIEDADVAFATIDPPDPPVGEAFLILVRADGSADYGVSSDGLPRRPSSGDCR